MDDSTLRPMEIVMEDTVMGSIIIPNKCIAPTISNKVSKTHDIVKAQHLMFCKMRILMRKIGLGRSEIQMIQIQMMILIANLRLTAVIY